MQEGFDWVCLFQVCFCLILFGPTCLHVFSKSRFGQINAIISFFSGVNIMNLKR